MRQRQRGFTLVEIMIVVAIIALLAAIAIPNVLRGRTTANESAAIGNMRALMSALEMFRSVNNVYPPTTTWQGAVAAPGGMYDNTPGCTAGNVPEPDFGPPSFCGVMSAAAQLRVQGYDYQYLGAAAPAGTYTIMARPGQIRIDGTRSFYVDQTGLIRHCREDGAALAATLAGMSNDNTIDQGPTVPCT